MALVLLLLLLSLWPLCHHTNVTPPGDPNTQGSSIYSTPPIHPASHHKPWLQAQPGTVLSPGVNVTLKCWAPQPAWRFVLFKAGVSGPVLLRDVAEFFLEEVTPAQGGSYRCCYQRQSWGLDVWSQPSDSLQLLVTDKLPRPSLVALPGPVVAPEATVNLRCAGRLPGMSFALYREGLATPLQYRHAQRPWVDFPLLGTRAPGTYSCYYHTPSAPYVLSPRSESLVISLDGSGSRDYTLGNLVRLGLAGLVLLALGTLLAFDWLGRAAPRAPVSGPEPQGAGWSLSQPGKTSGERQR